MTGRKVAAGTLTGADIDVSSLGVVPSAARAVAADNADAVEHQRLERFSVSFVTMESTKSSPSVVSG